MLIKLCHKKRCCGSASRWYGPRCGSGFDRHPDADTDSYFYLMRVQIRIFILMRLFTLMRIRIQILPLLPNKGSNPWKSAPDPAYHFHADPDFYLMLIRIRMRSRSRSRLPKWCGSDPQQWLKTLVIIRIRNPAWSKTCTWEWAATTRKDI